MSSQTQWRRVHWLSPVAKAWRVIAVVLGLTVFQFAEGIIDYLYDHSEERAYWFTVIGWAVLTVVLIFGLGAGLFIFAWLRTRWGFSEHSVIFEHGILWRKSASARLDRITVVEIKRPLAARVLGLCAITVEVGGGQGSGVEISYVSNRDGDNVRAEILDRIEQYTGFAGTAVTGITGHDGAVENKPANGAQGTELEAAGPGGVRPDDVAVGPYGNLEGEQPRDDGWSEEVLRVPTGRLLGATLLRGQVLVIVPALTLPVLMVTADTSVLSSPGALVGILGSFFLYGSLIFKTTIANFGFVANLTSNGIRVERGLTSTFNETVLPSRVYGVSVTQGVIWRMFGWWRVTAYVVGKQFDKEDEIGASYLLPVGSENQARAAMWLVQPNLGTGDPDGLLVSAMRGSGEMQRMVPSPRTARWLDPIGWRQRGFTTTETTLVIRKGRFSRNVKLIAHERIQSLTLYQGPIQRRLGLASVRVGMVRGEGKPKIKNISYDDAARLVEQQAVRSRITRERENLTQWRSRVAGTGAGITAD